MAQYHESSTRLIRIRYLYVIKVDADEEKRKPPDVFVSQSISERPNQLLYKRKNAAGRRGIRPIPKPTSEGTRYLRAAKCTSNSILFFVVAASCLSFGFTSCYLSGLYSLARRRPIRTINKTLWYNAAVTRQSPRRRIFICSWYSRVSFFVQMA
ncbi:hypothetical protein U1Q18_051120 [Sarracenia purpurea var. burkii]